MMTAEQFEQAWRRGRRRFLDVSRVEVSPSFIEAWQRRTAALLFERDRWLALLEAEPRRRGNYLRQARVDALDGELWTLALVRHHVQAINAAPLPSPAPPPGLLRPARRLGAAAPRR